MPEQGEPTESRDRAERAFRAAFAARADEAPQHPVDLPTGPRRRTWWVAGAAAAVLVAVTVPAVLLGGDGHRRASPAVDETTETTPDPPFESRRVSHRGTEVAVPADWGFGYGPVRPDCIRIDADVGKDPWAAGAPTSPYVEIEPAFRGVPAIGCFPNDRSGRGPKEFGDLPVELWQPHVLLTAPDFAGRQGEWEHNGWTLTRQTIGEASITVLAAPGDEALGEQVLSTAREVGIDANGCPTTSPVQHERFQEPPAAIPVPDRAPDLIAVCEYVRGDTGTPGLLASRQITGAEAEDLVRAIRAAPPGGGPDRPQNCVDDMYGDLAIVLRFLPTGWTARDVAYPEAYVYYDWCFGNGIVDGTTSYQLTRENCRPLFTEAPIRMWSASSVVADVCWPAGG